MHQASEDLSFLQFFLTEPIYLLPEPTPLLAEEKILFEEENTVVSEAEPSLAKAVQPKSSTLPLPETEGSNHKSILVLFYDKQHKTLKSEDKELLEKILKALNLSLEDIALCNWAPLETASENRKDIFESLQKIKSDRILAFGDLPLTWSLSHFFQKYHITREGEGKKLLLADDLQKIAQNRELKVQLWGSLQIMFQ